MSYILKSKCLAVFDCLVQIDEDGTPSPYKGSSVDKVRVPDVADVPNDLFKAHVDHLITAGIAPTQGTSFGIDLMIHGRSKFADAAPVALLVELVRMPTLRILK